MNEIQKQRLADCSDLHKGLLTRVYSGNRSLRDAIDGFCVQCVGYVINDVKHCTAEGCPLWLLRPYQDDLPKRERSEVQKAADKKSGERLKEMSQRTTRTLTESS